MENIITKMILSGETLDSIYRKLNVTKKLTVETFKSIPYSRLMQNGWNYLRIVTEKALFSLHKKYSYRRNCAVAGFALPFDYVIFEDGAPVLCIDILGYQYLLDDGVPIIKQEEYDHLISQLKHKELFCGEKHIPFLALPFCGIIEIPALATTLRDAIKSIDYAQEHNVENNDNYLDITDINICSYDNYRQITAANLCGCYHCGAIFKVFEMSEPLSRVYDDSAICPYCETDSLISDFQGFDVTPDLMETLKNAYEKIEDVCDYRNYQ